MSDLPTPQLAAPDPSRPLFIAWLDACDAAF